MHFIVIQVSNVGVFYSCRRIFLLILRLLGKKFTAFCSIKFSFSTVSTKGCGKLRNFPHSKVESVKNQSTSGICLWKMPFAEFAVILWFLKGNLWLTTPYSSKKAEMSHICLNAPHKAYSFTWCAKHFFVKYAKSIFYTFGYLKKITF